jgi:hypothetical protein
MLIERKHLFKNGKPVPESSESRSIDIRGLKNVFATCSTKSEAQFYAAYTNSMRCPKG